MEIKVYRGTHQIGGAVVAVSTRKTRIIIDMGSPVVIDEPYDAVVFTHYHRDHVSQAEHIAKSVPLYIGSAAKEILLLTSADDDADVRNAVMRMQPYEDGKTFYIGDIGVTPILTDHSAFDAYMLLIEGEGKRVLHTGDFRGHGIRSPLVLPALENLRNKVDLFICESTNLSFRQPVTTPELSLVSAAEIVMERFPYVFVLCGATDIDRLAVFHQSAEGRASFFCDAYQMGILDVVRERGSHLSPYYGFNKAQVYVEAMGQNSHGFVMAVRNDKVFRQVMKPFLDAHREKCLFIYAVPEGYLAKHEKALEKLTEGFRYKVKLHTSGHSSQEMIWQAVQILSPRKVLPIHTEKPENIRLGSLQNRVLYLEDGDTYEV